MAATTKKSRGARKPSDKKGKNPGGNSKPGFTKKKKKKHRKGGPKPDSRDSRDPRDPREPRPPRQSRNPRDPREPRESRESRPPRNREGHPTGRPTEGRHQPGEKPNNFGKNRFDWKKFKGKPGGEGERKRSGNDRKRNHSGKPRERNLGAPGTFKGVVQKNRRGFAFVIPDKKDRDDIFVSRQYSENLFHGDRVEVDISPEGDCRDIRVIHHRFREIVGQYNPARARERGGYLTYERRKGSEELYLPAGGNGAKQGDWIKATVEFENKEFDRITGKVTEVYGRFLPASAFFRKLSKSFLPSRKQRLSFRSFQRSLKSLQLPLQPRFPSQPWFFRQVS